MPNDSIFDNIPAIPGSKQHLSPSERLELAKKARLVQIQQYTESEKKVKAVRRLSKRSTILFNQKTLLLEASSRGDTNEVDSLLKKGADPNVATDDGLTALHQASIDNNINIVKVLIQNRANVNSIDKESWTPLHAAATCGFAQLAKILIESGASLLAVNDDGNMPYDLCEHPETLTLIEEEMFNRGITQEQIDKKRASREETMLADVKNDFQTNGNKLAHYSGSNNETLLHISCAYGFVELTNFLILHKCHVNSLDSDHWQPIHCAVYWGHINLVEPLLRHGADLSTKTKNGENAIDLCPNEEVKQQLLDIREEISRKGYAKRVSPDSLSLMTPNAIMRLSARDKSNVTAKDQKNEGLNVKKIFDENETDIRTPTPSPNRALRSAEQRVRRHSSTNLFKEDLKFKEKKCIIS